MFFQHNDCSVIYNLFYDYFVYVEDYYFTAADIERNRGPTYDTAESADRSRKNNSGTEDSGINKVRNDLIYRATYINVNSLVDRYTLS